MIAFFLLHFSKILTSNDQVSSNEFKRHLKCDLGCPRLFCLPREGKSVPAFLMSCQLHLCIDIRCVGHESNSTRKLCLENWIESRALHNVWFIISNITLLIMLKVGVKSPLKFMKEELYMKSSPVQYGHKSLSNCNYSVTLVTPCSNFRRLPLPQEPESDLRPLSKLEYLCTLDTSRINSCTLPADCWPVF